MTEKPPVDYLAAIEQLRQEEQNESAQIHDPDFIQPQPDEPVDYFAISKAWEIEQKGKDIIYLHLRKRNPSHDPEK